jgi:type II secretory pathway pseudopilin PulG
MSNRKGLTLIEMVVMIAVMGIAIPALLRAWADLSWRSTQSEAIADGTVFAQQLLEEIRAKRFDQRDTFPWTGSVSFGVDTGETAANSSTYTDIDDYAGSTDPAVRNPRGAFNRTVTVNYMYPDASRTWRVCPAATTCSAAVQGDCSSCDQCCYKRVTVTVSNPRARLPDISLNTMVAGY